jgi:hypothetical protein
VVGFISLLDAIKVETIVYCSLPWNMFILVHSIPYFLFQVRKFLSKIEEGRNLKAWKNGKKNPLKIKGGNSKIKRRSRENSSRKT